MFYDIMLKKDTAFMTPMLHIQEKDLRTTLEYPFDSALILKKRKSIKRQLVEGHNNFITTNIAILGGSTTHDIKEILELFLLNYGIMPKFYESEYGQYFEDAVFKNEDLLNFKPDIIYIHTSNRNILNYPSVNDKEESISQMLNNEFDRFQSMWSKISQNHCCSVIQNNFEMPSFRLLGNMDCWDIHGKTNYVQRLNNLFYDYAQKNRNFYINDINYLSASLGLDKWYNNSTWYLYKYCCNVEFIPELAYNLSKIIKSIYGKNKKTLVLDLDNTLWDGVIGDDGIEGIDIGLETAVGQAYSEFQNYLKAHKDLGILLTVNSKNDYENAIVGLNHPEGTLKPDDFICIKANWQTKDINIQEISSELNLLSESFVFVDDNPAERALVGAQIPGISIPEIGPVESYINILDKSGFFEVTNLSQDDLSRNKMYKGNMERLNLQKSFENYDEYLNSLEMRAVIKNFERVYLPRITQLINKSNQFNLTTKRYSLSEIEEVGKNNGYITLYGKLEDKFGDNGVSSLIIGKKEGRALHIDLWLMSCRVLKRGLECAMLDRLVEESKKNNINKITGYYFKTAKNNMVKYFYKNFNFAKISENANEDSVWELDIKNYTNKNKVIKVKQ